MNVGKLINTGRCDICDTGLTHIVIVRKNNHCYVHAPFKSETDMIDLTNALNREWERNKPKIPKYEEKLNYLK